MSNDLIVTQVPEQWVHYSSDPTEIVFFDTDQAGRSDDWRLFKPKGLWITPFGQEDNWFEWCVGEDFRKAELNYVHDVTLAKSANILRISSIEGLDAFSAEYATETLPGQKYSSWMYCDWPRLAEQYDGILITPYFWERRLMMRDEGKRNDWYYSWDCASGCIWRADAVESIKLRSDISAGYVSRDFGESRKKLMELSKSIQSV